MVSVCRACGESDGAAVPALSFPITNHPPFSPSLLPLLSASAGTGVDKGILATSVLELQFVDGYGDAIVCTRKVYPEVFYASLCSMGALGIITGVVIQCVDAFDLEAVETESSLPVILRDLPQRVRSAPFYRFWWFPHTDKVMEWRGQPKPSSLPSARGNSAAAAAAAGATGGGGESSGLHCCCLRRRGAQLSTGKTSSSNGSNVTTTSRPAALTGSAAAGAAAASSSSSSPSLLSLLLNPFLLLKTVYGAAVAGWQWLLFMGIGFHLLQFVLWLATALPVLIPSINKLWQAMLFRSRKMKSGRSDAVFNINCLFKQ